MLKMELSRESLQKILESNSIEKLPITELESLFLKEKQIVGHIPSGHWEIDPRNSDRIVYNASRRKRPHDNIKPEKDSEKNKEIKDCAICRGNTTGVLDVAELSDGFTFINKNLYPAVYPHENINDEKYSAAGFHFLQWTSSVHGHDWHNMKTEDCCTVMKRLAALEGYLLNGRTFLKTGTTKGSKETGPFVVIIKNYGKLVGGSLSHGHQQILYTNIMPRSFIDDLNFLKEHGETFSSYIMRENPLNLTVKDYGSAVLLVPFFMKRPYHMILSMKPSGKLEKTFLHELDDKELESAARGWHDAAAAITEIMPKIGRDTAYNIVTHNGPEGGLYFEFLPYTQELGGLEKLGFYICEGEPLEAAETLRGVMNC